MRCWDPDDQGDRNARECADVVGIACKIVAVLCGIAILAICALIFLGRPVFGHEGDDEINEWYRSLRQPGTNISCCNMMDCSPTPYRMTVDGYEVPLNGGWLKIPPEIVIRNKVNPTSEGVFCYSPTQGPLCFVPGNET